MGRPMVSVQWNDVVVRDYHSDSRESVPELVEDPQRDNRALRGVVTGIVLGTSLWAVILVLAGVIRL